MNKYNQYGKGYYPDLNVNVAGLTGIGRYNNDNPPIFAGELTESIQLGGYAVNKYQYIVNPKTNRKCRTDSKLGKQIIRNYYKVATVNL